MSAIFYVVAFISLVQLLICCFAEYKRLKNPSFLKACRVTTQKFLYFMVFLASLLRAAYFTQPESAQPSWAYYLMSAYYPLLMTCASLVICFWAEVRYGVKWNLAVIYDSCTAFSRRSISAISGGSDSSCRKASWDSSRSTFFLTVSSVPR